MDNTMRGAPEAALTPGEQSAVQNSQGTGKLKLLLVWLAVALPLIWGVIKTLEDGIDIMP